MGKHLLRALRWAAVPGAALMWLSANSIPARVAEADGNIVQNLKWLGWDHPPSGLASTAADHIGLIIGSVLFLVGALAFFFWVGERVMARRRPRKPPVTGSQVPEGPQLPNHPPTEFDLGFHGNRGAFVSNQIIGYDNVTIKDFGKNNLMMLNSFSREEISPWQLPKYPDGSSDLTRMNAIIQHVLKDWKRLNSITDTDKKKLLDAARPFINEQLQLHGETWRLDDDIQRRIGYGGNDE